MGKALLALWRGIDALARAVIRLIGKASPKLGALCLRLWDDTELVAYLFAGVATTAVNYVAYYFATRAFGLGVMPGTWAAWFIAVCFGYVVNKAFVFKSHCESFAALAKECVSFFAMRLVSLGMETALMYLTVEVLHFNDLVMKLVINLLVIVLNYAFSKLFIFRKK